MLIETKYNVGDEIKLGGVTRTILAVHLYKAEDRQTERYYLGQEEWLTIKTQLPVK